MTRLILVSGQVKKILLGNLKIIWQSSKVNDIFDINAPERILSLNMSCSRCDSMTAKSRHTDYKAERRDEPRTDIIPTLTLQKLLAAFQLS